MATYLVTFTPSDKYFFGNEKGFSFEKGDNGSYFIKGENLPLQSTLFGAVRYLLLPEKGYGKVQEYAHIIGSESLDITEEGQTFGVIKRISALFLCKGDEWFVPTPFDHNTACDASVYTPYVDYSVIETIGGQKLYTDSYDSKQGTEHSFMSLKDGHLERSLFESETQVGINRREREDGFFKKEYKRLKGGFSFAVLADIDDNTLDGKKGAVLLGQGKTPFTATFTAYSGESLEEKTRVAVSSARNGCTPYILFLSDCYLGSISVDEIYVKTKFGVVETRDYRTFKTNGAKVKKGSTLLHLIKAGSIIIPADSSLTLQELRESNACAAGFNVIVTEE